MVLSRHSLADHLRFDLRAQNLNAWCRVPGSPFTGALVLQPNPTTLPPVEVAFAPVRLPDGFDTFTFFVQDSGRPPHEHTLTLEIRALSADGDVLAASETHLTSGSETIVTLPFASAPGPKVGCSFRVEFEHFAGGTAYGSARLRYMLAYERNPLVEMCNIVGSDKGTEAYVGTGVPHCYAIDYHRLFAHLRDQEFRLLEIGLETASAATGRTTDAPSLRIWRDYFPHAHIYGYDINDFSFFEQDRTVTFQGDQSSREDLGRFLAEHGEPQFRLVIDDGSHASSHQQISLAVLFRSVEPGGIYVIEDLQWQPFPESPRTIEVLQRYLEGDGIRSPFISEDDAAYLEHTIDSVEIRKPNDAEIGVIRKKAG